MVGAYIATYLVVGVIWCVWNSSSRFFSFVANKMDDDGNVAWVLLAIVFGSLLWPLGLLVTIIQWISERAREGSNRRG